MANLTQPHGNSLAGYLISAPVSMFTSGDSLLFEVKLAISTRVRQAITLRRFQAGSTT